MDNKLSITTFLGKIYFRLTEKFDQKVLCKFRNKKLKNKDFTIISNNCFGGWVYRIFNMEYMSPTVGLFIMPHCFLKFVQNLEYYLSCKITFINPEESKYREYLETYVEKFGQYPIGKLDDIEIHFLHYKDEKEAEIKWKRRLKRVNLKKLIFKFNDQNGCTKKQIEEFCKLPLDNKLCFVSNSNYKTDKTIFIKEFAKNKYVIDDTWFCRRYINITNFINTIKIKE